MKGRIDATRDVTGPWQLLILIFRENYYDSSYQLASTTILVWARSRFRLSQTVYFPLEGPVQPSHSGQYTLELMPFILQNPNIFMPNLAKVICSVTFKVW